MSKKALGRGLSALFTQVNAIDTDLAEISVDQIDPTDSQPRRIFREDKLEELAQSISVNGIIQPIVVRRVGDRFQIIAGERRWRAAQKAGLHKVPCVVKQVADEQVLELSLVENIQREELNPIEEANAYRNLLDQFDLTQEEIARRVGKDRSSIANSLRLLKLPEEIQRMVEDGSISMGHARALLAIETQDRQVQLATEILSRALSVRDVERLAKQPSSPTAGVENDRTDQPDLERERANISAAETKLSKRLGAPVKIKFLQEGGIIEIKYSSTEDLMRLFDTLLQSASPIQ